MIEGASGVGLYQLGILPEWATRREDCVPRRPRRHGGRPRPAAPGTSRRRVPPDFADKINQLGSLTAAGNHFGECEVVQIADNDRPGRRPRSSACGTGRSHSRRTAARGGLDSQPRRAGSSNRSRRSSRTGASRSPARTGARVYAPLGTPRRTRTLDDMALGANFATINHSPDQRPRARGVPGSDPSVSGELVPSSATTSPGRRSSGNRVRGSTGRARRGPSWAAIRHSRGRSTSRAGHPSILAGDLRRRDRRVMAADDGAAAELLQREPRSRTGPGRKRRSAKPGSAEHRPVVR